MKTKLNKLNKINKLVKSQHTKTLNKKKHNKHNKIYNKIHGGAKTEITLDHYWFTHWPHDETQLHDPQYIEIFKGFITKLYNYICDRNNANKSNEMSIIIHCSSGIGRSGTVYVALNLLFRYGGLVSFTNNKITAGNIIEAITYARQSRTNMVSYLDQFKLLCEIFGIVNTLEDNNSYAKIPIVCNNLYEYKMSGFNRYNNMFPYENNRVMLTTTDTNLQSDYINASRMDLNARGTSDLISNGVSIKIIIAQGPNKLTTPYFLQMCIQNDVKLIVMVTQLDEKDKNGTLKENCYDYMLDGKLTELMNIDIKSKIKNQLLTSKFKITYETLTYIYTTNIIVGSTYLILLDRREYNSYTRDNMFGVASATNMTARSTNRSAIMPSNLTHKTPKKNNNQTKKNSARLFADGSLARGKALTALTASSTNNSFKPMGMQLDHYWFTDWPDHGVPNQDNYKNFIIKLYEQISKSKTKQFSIIIHCSAGVGRTGTVYVTLYLLSKNGGLKSFTNRSVTASKIIEAIRYARTYRLLMVQSQEQFNFLFEIFGVSPKTETETETKIDALVRLYDTIDKSDTSKILYNPKNVLGNFQNKDLNRYSDIVPYEDNRVTLKNNGNGDYINASHMTQLGINGITLNIIAAQGPKSNTKESFLQMCVEQQINLIVMVTGLVENDIVKCYDYMDGHDESFSHIPDKEHINLKKLKAEGDTTIYLITTTYNINPQTYTTEYIENSGFLHHINASVSTLSDTRITKASPSFTTTPHNMFLPPLPPSRQNLIPAHQTNLNTPPPPPPPRRATAAEPRKNKPLPPLPTNLPNTHPKVPLRRATLATQHSNGTSTRTSTSAARRIFPPLPPLPSINKPHNTNPFANNFLESSDT